MRQAPDRYRDPQRQAPRHALPPGDQATIHGFRATARTILDEVLGFRPDLIEHQLGRAVKDPNGRAYNRTAHLEARRDMMQAWADYLDKLKMGGHSDIDEKVGLSAAARPVQ